VQECVEFFVIEIMEYTCIKEAKHDREGKSAFEILAAGSSEDNE